MRYLRKYEDRYISDEEIEAGYTNYRINDFKVERIFDNGGASGYIEIFFDEDDEVDFQIRFDNWIKYDNGPKVAFNHWYPEKFAKFLVRYINKGVKEAKIKKDAEKYNL